MIKKFKKKSIVKRKMLIKIVLFSAQKLQSRVSIILV